MFVYLAIKAVHIEISADLSTETFLNILKRFISRRGRPANMYSDNATNFVGAENELIELREMFNNENSVTKIINSLSAENIQWHFIPPRAPHQGGLWEAAVKSAKRHLHKVLENASVRYDELITFTVQVEAVLNSRPLTVISADANDPSPLTPGHFLIGDSITSYPEPSLETMPINRLSRWQRIEQLRQHFWRRWSNDYLQACQKRTKWQTIKDQVKVGQVVMVQDETSLPLSWVLGKVETIHPGNDGIVRTVTVKTKNGIYKRPITKISYLPVEQDL